MPQPDPKRPPHASRARRALLLATSGLLAAPLLRARPLPTLPGVMRIEVERDGERFHVSARSDVAADPRTAWDTLIDYERLPQFVPGVARTRVLARQAHDGGERLTVEYLGSFKLLVFSVPTRVWLDVRHVPFTDVLARSAAGLPSGEALPAPTLKSFDGRYSLAVVGGGHGAPRVRLDYDARFELAEPLPPVIGALFGTAAIRHALREQFGAMVAEIERRSRQRHGLRKGG